MIGIRRMLAFAACAAGLVGAVPAVAQDEAQTFNAFAVVVANGSIVRAAEKQFMLVGNIAGPFFIETDEGPVQAGRVACATSARIDQATRTHSATGACTFAAEDGATAWGEWQCTGYELVGCRGTFKLTGGTGRLTGASGEGALIWRPTAHELKKQLDGNTLDNATGILMWREFKLKGK